MAIDGTLNEENGIAGALVPQDSGAAGSVYDEYYRRVRENSATAMADYESALRKAVPEYTAPTVRQSTFETYDPDPTGVHTKAEGERNGSHWGSNYVKELVVAGKLMSADELNQTEAGRRLLGIATRARLGHKRDFFDAITDFQWSDVPFLGMFASVGKSFKDAYDVSKTIDRLNAGEDVDAESRAKLGLYMAENAEQSQGTWGSKVGDIVRAAPGFMIEFFLSGGLFSAARRAVARRLAEQGSAKALSTYGLARTTKMLADETAADAMGAVIREFAETSAEGATKAGLASAARAVMGNEKVRADVVKSVADALEKSVLSSEAAAVTGANAWGSGMVRKVAEARAATAVEGYLKTHAASGSVEKSTRALGRALADGFSRGALDVGTWGTEQSTALFTSGTSAGRALADALTTFFVEAPLKGGELYLADKAVAAPVSAALGGTVGNQELAIKLAALQNNDQELMNRAHAIGLGLELLEYVSENTGRGLRGLGRAGILKFAPKLVKPAARVAGEMHFTKAALKRNAANEVVGAELEGLVEKGRGAEVGGIIQRYVSRVLGNPDDVKTNVLSDQVTAVTRALRKDGVRVSNPAALAATIREGAPVAGLSRDVAEKLGDDVGGYVKKALRAAYDEKADGMKLRGMVNYYMADYMARKQIGPQTAAAIFERMGYDGILGEMFEERYSDVMSGLFGLNADKDRSVANRLRNAWDGFFPGWDQLTAEAVGFAFPMVAKAGFQRALRAIGGGNAYTEFADTAALYLDGTRHGSVGQWRYGDVLTGHARAVRAERDKITAAQQRREKALSERPELADAQWDADNIAPIDVEIATAEKAITRIDAHHQRFLSSLSNEQRTGYSHLVSYAPMSAETAELPDAEFDLKLAATEADAARSVSAAKVLTSRAGRMGQTLYKLENRAVDEDERAFRKAAHWVVKVAGVMTTGDVSLFSANPAQWVGVDRGLPEGVQTQLKKGYGKIFAAELERDRNERISNVVFDRSAGPTYQADLDAAHARALERFNPIAERIMAASLAAHQARMFSDQELTDAAIAEVARGKGLMLDEAHREFVSTTGERQSISDFHEANRTEIRKLRNKAASTLFDTLSSGSLQSGRIVFNRTRDDANPVVDVIDIPKNLPTEEQAVVSMILKRVPGMQNVLRAHEIAADRPIDDQVSGPATRQEWLDAVVRSVVPEGKITADSMKTALDNAMTVDPVVLENIARDLNFQYDGTDADLVRRNREIVELAVLSKTLGDPNVRTYARDGAMAEDDPAASEWTDYVSARRRADGLWTYLDAAGRSQIATSAEDLDAKMAEQGRWAPVSPKVVFTSAQIFQSSDAMTMMSALGLKRQYRDAMNRQCDDVDYKDPLFREGADTYNDPVRADAVRAEEKALSDLYERNSRQTNPQLYLAPDESAQDAAAMRRAEKRMKRAQDAYFRRNDEKRGYARIADDLLRRNGVSVPFGPGFSVGLLNADLRGKYTISLNAFNARRQSGNVFVPIDHGIAQNYKSALLNAVMQSAYVRNKKLIASMFDSGIRGFMDDVNRVAQAAQDAAKDKTLAANIADFRAATVDHERGQERKPSPMTFSLLVRAFALYQTEHDGNLKSVLGDYAPALKAIAPAVRNLPSFQVFMAVADRVFGGSGFNPAAIRARGGADNTTGLARVYGLFAPAESASLRAAIERSRPGGLSAEEFLARVSEQDVSAVKAGLKRTSSKPRARTEAQVDVAPVVTDEMRAAQERLAARRAQQAAARQADNPVSDVQATQEAVAAGQIKAADENALNALVSAVGGKTAPADGTRPVSEETAKAAARARLADIRERQSQVRADIGGGEATDAQQEELSALSDEETRLENAIEEPAEGLSALESAAADEVFGALPIKEVDGDEAKDEVEDDLFFIAGDVATMSEDTSSETSADGEQKSFVLKDKAELTQGEVKALVPVLAKMLQAVNNSGSTEDEHPTENEFRSFIRQLAPGVRERDVDLFAKTYSAMDAKSRQNEFDDLWTWDSDDDEEGALPDGVEDGGRKSVMALQTKALSNFLALAQLVNPHTGRQFQGFMEDLRNTVARSLAVSGDTPSGALQFVNDLVNPRARDAASPAIRDAYFAETMAKFVTRKNNVAGYIRDLVGTPKSHPLNRKAAVLVAYLAAMPANVRRQMTQLVSSSAPSVPLTMSESFHDADGYERQGKRAGTVTFTVSRRRGNASRLSSDAVAATFREFVGKTPDQIRAMADAILADAREMANAGRFTGAYASRFSSRGNAPSLFNSMAELFERHFGADSTIVSVFSSHPAGAYIAERPEAKAVRDAMTAVPGKVPFMVDTIVGGLQLIADVAGKSPATSENADLAAALSFTMGDPRKAGLGWKTNTSYRTDQIATVFRAYEEMMPQTIMTASVDPDRTNQPASSVAITMRGVEPAVQVFMDRAGDKGFRAVCERFFPQFAKADEATKRRVLGICRQSMCWPTPKRDGIVGKSLSKSAFSRETYLACETSFNLKKGILKGTPVEELQKQYGTKAVAKAMTEVQTTVDPATGRTSAVDRENTFYVPVYSGDHSSAILISVPLLSSFRGTYEEAAKKVSSWVGLDLLGVDAKRSATTSLEAPGVGFIGLKHNPDGTVKTKGQDAVSRVEDLLSRRATGTTVLTPADARRAGPTAKDQAKFNQLGGITKYIGVGREGSSTDHYGKTAYRTISNTGAYSADDIVGVSVNGAGARRVPVSDQRVMKELDAATGAGSIIVADTKSYREASSYNVGERELADYLSSRGYKEVRGLGIWVPGAGEPETGECRINIVWSEKGGNESMLGTTLATGYGVEQLKLCAKDPRSSTLKFHAMNTANTGSYGPALSLIKSLNIVMGQTSDDGEFGKWSAARPLMDFIRRQRSSDFADSTSILTDFDSVKLSLANSKMMGVRGEDGKPVALMEWFFGKLAERVKNEATLGALKDSYSGAELDTLFATEDNPEGLVDWIDLTDETTGEKRSGKRKLSSILDGVRLDFVDGLDGRAYSLSYVDNDMMGFQVANVSHRAETKEKGKTHYGKSPRNYVVDAFTMAQVQTAWNADAAVEAAHPRPVRRDGESDSDFAGRTAEWERSYGAVFTGVEENAKALQDLVARWGEIAVAMATDERTVEALRHDSEDAVNAAERGEPADGQFMRDIMARAVSTYLKKYLNLPMKGIDAPLVSNMSWVENGEVKTHSANQMFKDTLRGSVTIPRKDRSFMRAHRRMALCSLNNCDASFRYGMYLDEDALEREFSTAELDRKFGAGMHPAFDYEALDGNTPEQKVVAALDRAFTWLRDLEEKLSGAVTEDDQSAVAQTTELRRKIAACFLDHHGRTMDTHVRHYTVKGEARTAQWYLEVSYDDLFTNLVKDANGRPTFDRSAVYEGMTDSKGVKRMYLGGTMVGLPRTPSYNGSMWLQTVRAALPVTEIEREDGDWSAGRDAMVAPDPYTLKILGCDHDGDKTKLYMLEAPSVSADARSADARAVRDARRFLDLNADVGSLVRPRTTTGAKKANGKVDVTEHELELTPVAQMQANNSFVQALFDMSRALPVMDNSDGSSPFYTGERVSETKNHGAVARGTKAALTAALKDLAGEDGAELFAWDAAVTKNPDVIGPKLLDPARGRTVGDPLTAAEVGDGAQNAASARALVVSLASSLHLAWASGLFRDGLFRGIGTGAEEARNWLDFMYHLDGFSNMTFDDIKEQVCSRLGVTAGMMDTIVCDMVNYGRRIGHLPRTDEEFIDAFKGYAKDVKDRGMRFYMKRATDTGDYAMQARVRETFAGSAESEVTAETLNRFFGGAYDWEQKKFVVTDPGAKGARLIAGLRTKGAEEYAKTYGVDVATAQKLAERVVNAVTKMRTKFSDISGAVMYAVDHFDGKTLADLIAWHEAKTDLRKAKQFARSVNYLTADPVANNAEAEAETRTDGFASATEDAEFTEQVERLSRMNATVKAVYAAVAGETVHGYGLGAAESYEDDVTVFCANGGNDRLALKLIAAQRVDANDAMAVEAAAEMTGLSLAALRSTRVLPGSKINSGNILKVLARIGLGSYKTVRNGTGAMNRVLDMKRGIEDMFELMYRLVQSSTARSSLPIFTYFSERNEGAFGYDYASYYDDERTTDHMNRITLAFQGVTESQIADVRRLYDRVVAGELDNAKRVGAYDKEATDFNFTLSAKNLDALLASKDMLNKILLQDVKGVEREAIIGLVAETKAIIAQLEKELGGTVEITPSVMFGQILPAYAALTTRLDRVPDSRSSSIVTAMGDTYSRWAAELANLRRNHPSLMRMATAINFAPSMAAFEAFHPEDLEPGEEPERPKKPGVRWKNAQLQEMLDRDVAKLLMQANSEVDEKHTVFQTKSGKQLRKRLVDGEYVLGNPAGRYIVDPFGNSTVYWDIYEALGAKAESAPADEPDPVVETMPKTIRAEDAKPALPEENPYVRELADRMGALVRNWTNARVEYRGGSEFFIHADLRGSKATAKNHNGKTAIRVAVRNGALKSDAELKDILKKNLSGEESSWLLSNAVRRSDATGKKVTAEQVKAELLAMSPDDRFEYIKAWRPVGVTHNDPKNFSAPVSEWTVDANAAGVLCREIELERQTKYPNVAYHEYFHAVVGMFKELGVFSAADVSHLQKRYGRHPFRQGWFDEDRAAEDFRRFAETGYVKNEDTRSVFQKLFDFCKALFEALTKTGVRSADYENEMSGSPLAAMVLTGTAELSHDAEDKVQPGEFDGLAETGAAVDEAPVVISEPSGSPESEYLFPLPEARAAKSYLKSRLDRAYGNYTSLLLKEALDNAGNENYDNRFNVFSQNPSVWSVNPSTREEIANGETRGHALWSLAEQIISIYGMQWNRGDSILSIPKTLFDSLSELEQEALYFSSREGAMLTSTGVPFEETDNNAYTPSRLLYGFGSFLSDYEALMASSKKYVLALMEGGTSEDKAREAANRQLQMSGKSLASEYDRSYGFQFGAMFHMAYRKFLTKYGNLNQDSGSEESMFDCAAPTAEEQIDDQLDAVVDPDRMRAVYSPADTLARAVGMSIRNSMSRTGLDEEAREVLSTIGSSKARELHGLERAAAVDAVRQVAAQRGIDPASLKGKELENLTFAAIVELNSAIRGGGRAQGPIKFRNLVLDGESIPGSGGSVETKDPFRITSSALAGSIMAACGTTPADIGTAVKRDIAKMRERYAGTTFEQVLDKFDRAMDVLVAADPSRLCEDPSFREDTLGDLLHSLESGLVGGNTSSDGSRDNYRLAGVGTSFNPSFDANRAVYGNHVDRNGEGNPDFQYIAHRTIDSLYTVLAGLKFYRQLGFEPGSAEDVFADAPTPNTPDQTAAYLGIEARQLLDRGAEALDYYDQPMFVANNMESWLESTVRDTFGHVDVGEFMRGMNNRHSGYMRRLVNEENWNASLMGLDVLPGQALAAVEEVQGRFSMENGSIVRKDGKTYYRFVRYSTGNPIHGRKSARDETGTVVSLTEDEARMCDLVLKADKVFATGGRRIVTGVDRIRFTADDKLHTDASYYSRANVEKRFASGEEFSEFDRALYRLDRQMPPFIADNLRAKFIETAMSALRGADGTAAEITDHVLRRLDAAGILVAHEEYDRTSDTKRMTHGALTLDIDDVERLFAASSAREKLIKAGRKESWLTREARVRPLMSLYREVASYVRENPWLTDGDGAFFNNFNTTIPFVQGSGVFMYNANRSARSVPARDPGEKMSDAETRFAAIMETIETSREVKPAVGASDDQLRLLGSVFGLKDMGPDAIRNAIARGDLSAGGQWSRTTGIALPTNATIADVAEEIYRRLVESTWRKNGDPVTARVGGTTVVQRLIQAYERHKDSQQALAGGVGAADEMMYRTRGVLPANAQLGHAIHNAMEGITNSLAFRGTLVNMLMAPDAEGHPTVYADPNLLMADAGGVPDAVWSTIARWWADVNHLEYDETKSGIQNAHDIYKKLHDEFALRKTINGKGFGELSGEDIDAKSITGVMAQNDDRDETLNKLGGGYAMGYVKHLLQASRNFGTHAQRAVIHRALSYSKSLSVSFSMFFPLATMWESPIGAVGAVATLGSNLDPEWLRNHADVANAVQKAFSGDGWITQNFIGFRDIVRMMDSNDPFLSEMIGWASSLGISLSDSRVNPLEPQRAILQRDVRNLVEMTRDKFGAKAAARLDGVLRTCLLNSGEKAFTYALNATKLATVAQIYMKLRHQAEKRGRAFDPVRDLKRYAGYINAEIGGIDPLKYAWAHPMNRGLMSMLMFSWEWTRGAWEAGGGGAIEDMVFGGHSMTAEERKYIVGRWARMFGAVMIGVPVLFQFAIKAFAMAMGHDDDTEKWWTWQNEDKAKWTAFDLTPLLRAMTERFPPVAQWKKDHPVLGAALPVYTGSDKGNRTHGSFFSGRHYYMHFGKQGWEFFRWFSDATGQFFSKLSMPTQRILEGVFGRSLSWMDRELPWGKMGPVERWLAPTADGATANLVKAFLPFTYTGLSDMGDAGLLSAFGPIQMGAADSTIKAQMEKVLRAYAFNDRAGMALGNAPHGTKSGKFRVNVLNRNRELWHLARIAQLNGASVKESLQLIDSAIAGMTASLYGDLLDALPEKVDGDFDARRVSRVARAINRLQRDHKTVMDKVEEKLEKRRTKLDPKLRRQWDGILKRAMERPYDEPKRTDY